MINVFKIFHFQHYIFNNNIHKINIVLAEEKIVIKSIKKKEMKNFKRQTW
jgi:hypothetical protein